MIGPVLATLVTHGTTAVAAFASLAVIHLWSGRKIWIVLGDTQMVRQLSVYLINAIPFFMLALAMISLLVLAATKSNRVPIVAFAIMGIGAVGLAILMHIWFFPVNLRAAIFLLFYAVFYIGLYPCAGWAGSRLRQVYPEFQPFPKVSNSTAGILTTVVFAAAYVFVFQVGYSDLQERETYRAYLEPSPRKSWYAPSPGRRPDAPQIFYSGGAPSTGLFEAEELPMQMIRIRIVDIDGDGDRDIVDMDKTRGLVLWLNQSGVLEKKENFIPALKGDLIGNFEFADFDQDGKQDLLIASYGAKKEGVFENAFLKQLIWYPSDKPAAIGRLFRQVSLSKWEDVTETAFHGSKPEIFRKLEPITWFDANGDGRLDIIWPGYPHPRKSANRLYLQNVDDTFTDAKSQLLDWKEGLIHPEGSDVGDIDGDGDIDMFAFGYLFIYEGGKYRQVCGEVLAGIVCGASGRLDEGGLIEDIDGDGVRDLILSYHGGDGKIPKFFLQFFRGNRKTPGTFTRIKKAGNIFYGFNTYLRAKDFDFNGRPDILTTAAGRLLSWHQDNWVDLLPAITGAASGAFSPLGWIDIDEDGDWDFLARRLSDNRTLLFRNRINPQRYAKISVLGAGGIENQFGASVHLTLPSGQTLVRSYRRTAGYQGYADARLIFPLEPDVNYPISVCFTSRAAAISKTDLGRGSVYLRVTGTKRNCVSYELQVGPEIKRLDLNFLGGAGGAHFSTSPPDQN